MPSLAELERSPAGRRQPASARAKAGTQLDADDNKRKAKEDNKEAGRLYEECASRKIERGEVADGRPCLEWAETCYLRAGEKEAGSGGDETRGRS